MDWVGSGRTFASYGELLIAVMCVIMLIFIIAIMGMCNKSGMYDPRNPGGNLGVYAVSRTDSYGSSGFSGGGYESPGYSGGGEFVKLVREGEGGGDINRYLADGSHFEEVTAGTNGAAINVGSKSGFRPAYVMN